MQATAASATSRPIVAEIVKQHVEMAAFQWAQRDTLMEPDPPDMRAVRSVDQRLEANLDGLRIAGSAAWPLIESYFAEYGEKGELFLYAWFAIELDDTERVAKAVEFGRAAETPLGLFGALNWHRAGRIASYVRDWIGSHDGFRRLLAVSACLGHRVDPKRMLERLVRDPDARVRALAMRLAGALKRADLGDHVRAGLDAAEADVRFWSAWSLTEIGQGAMATSELKKVALGRGPDALTALRAIVNTGPEKDVRAWMGILMKSPKTSAVAVRGAGMFGDKSVRPWLIDRMAEPENCLAAASAFLELHGEVDDQGTLFEADDDVVLEKYGPPFAALGADIPAPAKFEKLLEDEKNGRRFP
jgi:uncharacterized protein (TIGR02270 family)